jgi:hypothetical protein
MKKVLKSKMIVFIHLFLFFTQKYGAAFFNPTQYNLVEDYYLMIFFEDNPKHFRNSAI